MPQRLLALGLCSLVISLSSCQKAPYESDSKVQVAYPTKGSCDGLPKLQLDTAPGVCVGLVADGFKFPRGVVELPSGDLIVADMGGWGKDIGSIWRLRKLGSSWQKTQILGQIDKPSGIALGADGLVYVGTPSNIFRFRPDEMPKPRLELVVDGLPSDGRHPLKHFVFDPQDPTVLYVNIGSFSDVCEMVTNAASHPFPCAETEQVNGRGTIRRYKLGGSDNTVQSFETVARGLRNSMALAVHPESGILLQGENSRDSIDKLDPSLADLEGELPHEELNVIRPGQHYGWPYCYDNGALNPEYRNQGIDCRKYQSPALLLPGHAAPLGMQYYTGALFPPIYKNQLIAAYHGYRDNGHRLVMVPVDEEGKPGVGEPLDIIRGWDAKVSPAAPQGAPVDVELARDGAILLTEDKNGTVLRVSYNPALGDGKPLAALPPKKPVQDPTEKGRCDALKKRTDPLALMQKQLLDTSCVSCHGVGPGFPGKLALLRCDADGNAQRLLASRQGGGPLVVPKDRNSELVLRIKGQGFPQMPAGGVNPEQLESLFAWIDLGAPAGKSGDLQLFCPSGARADLQMGYCVDETHAYGPFSQAMVDRCVSSRGGPACKATVQVIIEGRPVAIARWSKAFAANLRGTDDCMLGTSRDQRYGICIEKATDSASGQAEAFGPFSKVIVNRCVTQGGGGACYSNRWSLSFYQGIADGLR